jgi:hypothetical protein
LEIETAEYEIEQVMLTLKNHITRQGPCIIEKGLAPGKHLAKQGIFFITPLQNRMAQKGEQVEAEQKRRPGESESCSEILPDPVHDFFEVAAPLARGARCVAGRDRHLTEAVLVQQIASPC